MDLGYVTKLALSSLIFNKGCIMHKIYVVAGTGSRSLQLADLETKRNAISLIRTELSSLAEEYGNRLVVMSGMAEGFDKALAVTALDMGLRLWLAIPTKSYGAFYWGKTSFTGENRLDEFNHIVAQAEEVTYVMEEVHGVTNTLYIKSRHANFIRNDYMVEKGDEFLVWDPTSRGTKDCLRTIKKLKKPYKVLF